MPIRPVYICFDALPTLHIQIINQVCLRPKPHDITQCLIQKFFNDFFQLGEVSMLLDLETFYDL